MAFNVSKSKVVSMKPSTCSHNGCINRVRAGDLYCTLHDSNPMFQTKNKGVKHVPASIEANGYCCPSLWTLFM